jgi:hypothetical protein
MTIAAEPRAGSSIELLERLTQADAVPGHETEVREIFRSRLSDVGELATDRLGSIYCTKRGTSGAPRVLIDSHLDEVGFIVQSVTPGGMVKFLPLGNWWPHALLAQRVRVLTRDGKVPGVIGSRPPHVLKPSERDRVLDGRSCSWTWGPTAAIRRRHSAWFRAARWFPSACAGPGWSPTSSSRILRSFWKDPTAMTRRPPMLGGRNVGWGVAYTSGSTTPR